MQIRQHFAIAIMLSVALCAIGCGSAESTEDQTATVTQALSNHSFTLTAIADDLSFGVVSSGDGPPSFIPNAMSCNSQGPFWQALATPVVNCKYVWIAPGANQLQRMESFGDVFFNNAHNCNGNAGIPANPVVGVTNVRYEWTLSVGSGGMQIRPLVRTSTNPYATAAINHFVAITPNFNGTFDYDLNSNPDTMVAWNKADLGCGHGAIQAPDFGFQVINGSAPSGISGFSIRVDYQTKL